MKVKVISLNIWGGKLLQNVIKFLRHENADILMLQEVYSSHDHTLTAQYHTYEVLGEKLQYKNSHYAKAFVEDYEGKDVIQGNAVFSKFPLSKVSVTHYAAPYGKRIDKRPYYHLTPRNLQHVIARIGVKDVHLLNTQGIWGEDGLDNPARLAMSETILNEVDNNTPLVLAGDFNTQPDTQSIGLIEKKLISIFKNELKTTFNLKQKNLEKYPGYATAVVDMMFVTPDITVVEQYVGQNDVSDHVPLISTLEIK